MTPRNQQWFNLDEQLPTCNRCGQVVVYLGDKSYCVNCRMSEDARIEVEDEE